MAKIKTFRWVVEFTVDETWVADGFNLTDASAREMLAHELSWANEHEFTAKVLKAPRQAKILKAQGY